MTPNNKQPKGFSLRFLSVSMCAHNAKCACRGVVEAVRALLPPPLRVSNFVADFGTPGSNAEATVTVGSFETKEKAGEAWELISVQLTAEFNFPTGHSITEA